MGCNHHMAPTVKRLQEINPFQSSISSRPHLDYKNALKAAGLDLDLQLG